MPVKSVPIGLKRDHAEKIGNENDKPGCKHPHFTSMNEHEPSENSQIKKFIETC